MNHRERICLILQTAVSVMLISGSLAFDPQKRDAVKKRFVEACRHHGHCTRTSAEHFDKILDLQESKQLRSYCQKKESTDIFCQTYNGLPETMKKMFDNYELSFGTVVFNEGLMLKVLIGWESFQYGHELGMRTVLHGCTKARNYCRLFSFHPDCRSSSADRVSYFCRHFARSNKKERARIEKQYRAYRNLQQNEVSHDVVYDGYATSKSKVKDRMFAAAYAINAYLLSDFCRVSESWNLKGKVEFCKSIDPLGLSDIELDYKKYRMMRINDEQS